MAKTKKKKKKQAAERIRIGEKVYIQQRGVKKIWNADFWNNGRHCRQSLRTANRTIAERRARELDVQLASGIYKPPAKPTALADAKEWFIAWLRNSGCAHKTIVKYSSEIGNFLTHCEQKGIEQDRQLSIAVVNDYMTHRRTADNLQPYTAYTHAVILKTWLKRCAEHHVIAVNPLAELKLRKARRTRQAAATQTQVDGVLEMARGSFLALLATLAFAGLRIGEAQALRKSDVELDGGWIQIASRADWRTKTVAGERKIPIHARLLAILEAMPPGPGPLLFTAPPSQFHPEGGHPINPRQINVRFKALATKQGFGVGRASRGLVVHSLRHFFKTAAVNAGVPKPLIDQWVGHEDKNSMDAVYYHPSDEASALWMTRVPFGDVRDQDLKHVKEK